MSAHSDINTIPDHTGCTNCGKCCGVIPATQNEVDAIRGYLARTGFKALVQSERSVCPFRDTQAKRCIIYPVRPVVCRLYGATKGIYCPEGNSAEIDPEPYLDRSTPLRILNEIAW